MTRFTSRYFTTILLLSLGLTGCQSIPYYKTINSMAVNPAAIAQADRFSIRPVNFEEVEMPGSYVTMGQFLEEMQAEVAEFTEELHHQAQRAGVGSKVMMLDARGSVPSGVLVEAHVVEVKLGWDFSQGGADYLVMDLFFKDAQTGEPLFESRIQTSSRWPSSQGHKMNESKGRMGIATWNLVRPIISVIKHGQISPATW